MIGNCGIRDHCRQNKEQKRSDIFLESRGRFAQSGAVESVALLEIAANTSGGSETLLVLDRDKCVGHDVVQHADSRKNKERVKMKHESCLFFSISIRKV